MQGRLSNIVNLPEYLPIPIFMEGTHLMRSTTTKIDLYIILSALILALVILVLFWALNRGEAPTNGSSLPSPTSMEKPAGSETPANSIKREQSTVAHQGLTKLIEPSIVNALVFGDYIAESRGSSNKDLSSWYGLVANDLHSKYSGTIQWHFKTEAGATINDVLKSVPEATSDTDLIVLCLGRNDSSRIRLTEFKKKYEQLLVELKAKSPYTNLFLVVEPPFKTSLENNRYFPYRKIILDLGQKYQIPVIDQWTSFINDSTPLSGLLVDNADPNDKGYRLFADTVLKGFEGYLMPAY